VIDDGGTTYTVATATNWEATAQAADPLYTNPSAPDFTLQSGSPAIDNGADLGVAYDDALKAGSSWPDSVVTADQDLYGVGWEIGAYVESSTMKWCNVPISQSTKILGQTGMGKILGITITQ